MIVLPAHLLRGKYTTKRGELDMQLIVPLVLAVLLVLSTSPSFSSVSAVVLGTVSRVLTTIDVNGDGRPDTVSFDARTRLFTIQGPGNSFGADPIGPYDRVMIWDFDRKIPGSGFVHLAFDGEASNKSVTIYRLLAFRWETKLLTPSYQVYITSVLGSNAGTPVDWYVQATQQSLTNWVTRREQTWQLINQIQQALKAGKDHKPFLAKDAVIPSGSLRLLQGLQPDWAAYEEERNGFMWYGPVGRYYMNVMIVLEQGIFKLKKIRVDR